MNQKFSKLEIIETIMGRNKVFQIVITFKTNVHSEDFPMFHNLKG